MGVDGTLVEEKMRRFEGECAHFGYNRCPLCTHDGAGAKFGTDSHETDNSAGNRNQFSDWGYHNLIVAAR